MGGVESKVNVSAVEKEVQSHPVVMFSKSGCQYCKNAHKLFKEEHITVKENNLDVIKTERHEDYKPLVNGLVYATRTTGLPQIFICGKFIGGYADLENLHKSKELLAKIAECTGENAPKEE